MNSFALTAGIRQLRRKLAGQQLSEDSDEQLLHAFTSRRDDNAFAALVRRHGPMVLHVCRRVLGHEQDAEDAFQATFLVLARNAAALRNKLSLSSWLYGTAYRTALKAKQSAARRRKHEERVSIPPKTNPADELLWREVRELLDEEIAGLPETLRSVFVLCCMANVSQEEAGRRLGLKQRTVSNRLTAARKRLAQRLSRRGVELTTVLAASALATPEAPALSPLLLSTTIKAAMATAAGEETAGLVSAHVALLTKSASSTALLSKTKIMMASLVAGSILAGVAAWSACTSRLPPPAASKSRPPQARNTETPQQEKDAAMEVNGRVLGPDGKPVKGARLFSTRLRREFPHDFAAVAIARTDLTDAEGRFHVRIKKPDSEQYAYLFAHAASLGVDWINLAEDDLSSDVTLRLVDDVPITGRVVNTEGRPVAGVSVAIAEVWVPPKGKLDDYLQGWLHNYSDTLSSPRKRLYAPLDAVSTALTDTDGRFTLHGAGGERLVHVTFSGGGMARTTLYVITRSGFDAKPYNAVLQKEEWDKKFVEYNRFLGLFPPSLTFVAEAGKTIEGVVKDSTTGKPLAGCKVATATSYAHGIAVVTDAEGKYRLEGLAKRAHGFYVSVLPPKGSAHLHQSVTAPDTPGFTKVQLDIELVKGAIVTGRVVDKQTGKGVKCGIRAVPLSGNKYFGAKPGFDRRDAYEALEHGEDGRFRLITIPGKVLVLAQVPANDRPHLYRSADRDLDHKEIFMDAGETWRVLTASGSSEFGGSANAVKVMEVKENGENRVELSVDRGKTARITVQDAEGKPLPGAWASGLTDFWPICHQLPEATATVYALNPEKPRTMAFYHAVKKLGGTATVRGDEKKPIVVTLAPVGKISGRLLDGEGNPLQGVEVSINAETTIGSELYRFAAPTGKPARTDKDGRFCIEGVVPALAFRLNLRKERIFFVGEPRLGVKQIKPGEALDLGNVRVKPG